MSKKLYTVQAVLKHHFNNRPSGNPLYRSAQYDPVLPIPPERRATMLQLTKDKAISEAERLARANPTHVFLVMESTHIAFQDEFVSRPMGDA